MNRRTMSAVILSLVLLSSLGAKRKRPAGFAWRRESNQAFQVGETITYGVRYGVVPSGTATLRVDGIQPVGRRKAYFLVSEAKSSKSVDVFHKIRERQESWMDTESLSALKFHDASQEGRYRRDSTTTFDVPRRSVRHVYKTSKSEGETGTSTPPYAQDTISVIYYLRTRDLKPGTKYEIPINTGGENFMVTVLVKGIEKIKTPAGKFDCFHVQPVAAGKSDVKGQLEVWLTTDERRVPVLLRTHFSLGAFDARMTAYQPS